MTQRPYPGEEPGAGARGAAKAVREAFVALVQEGFTEDQALIIVGQILVSASASGSKESE